MKIDVFIAELICGGKYQLTDFLAMHGVPESWLVNRVDRIMAISPKDLSAMAKKYIRPQDKT